MSCFVSPRSVLPPPLQPMSRDGVSDMFWEQPWWQQGFIDGCKERFGVEPRPLWAATQWGGRKISASSNIIFCQRCSAAASLLLAPSVPCGAIKSSSLLKAPAALCRAWAPDAPHIAFIWILWIWLIAFIWIEQQPIRCNDDHSAGCS